MKISDGIFSLCDIIPSTEDHNPKWKLNKANWEQFHLLCEQDFSMDNFNNSSDLVTDFTSSLMKISDKCIPKTSGVVGWCDGTG